MAVVRHFEFLMSYIFGIRPLLWSDFRSSHKILRKSDDLSPNCGKTRRLSIWRLSTVLNYKFCV